MADDGLTVKIDEALAERFRARAKAAGQTVEAYLIEMLRRVVAEPGFEEKEAPWNGTPVHALPERDAAYWRELEAICDEADRTGGVPWEQVEARLLNFGQKR